MKVLSAYRSPQRLLMLAALLVMTCPLWAQSETQEQTEPDAVTVEESLVITASKRPEKRMEAPSTIETVTSQGLLESAATTFSGALAQVKGVDFANGGINLQKVSTRGFSSSFNSRMLSLVDGRLSTLPGAGLPQGGLAPVSSLDIRSMELILGPAGALYGSNTTAGVLNIITKTPWDEEGLSVAFKGGEQNLVDAKFRYAQVFEGGWGFKLTGQYLSADEFVSDNVFDVSGANQTGYASQAELQAALDAGTAYREEDLVVGDYDVLSTKAEMTAYYRRGETMFTALVGWSENDSFGVTNVGRNRIDGWEIGHVQFKASAPRWFFQVTRTGEDAGNTYSIQNVPAQLAAGLSLEQAADAAKFINDSYLNDVEFQTNYEVGNLFLVAGLSYREYQPNSEGSYLDDFILPDGTKNDISRDEKGVYLQADWRLMEDRLRVVAAGRYDDFSEFDSQFSPKLGVTYNVHNHHLRANFMSSYRAPEIIETHLYFFNGLARGNLNGFTIQDAAGNTISEIAGLAPEEVTTFEVGYRGLFNNALMIDAVAYRSDYEDFISPLQVVAHPAFGTTAVDSQGAVLPLLFTYLNYGKAQIEGFDLGVDYFFNDKISLKSSIGYAKLDSFENTTTIPDIPFNTPEWKYKASLNIKDLFAPNSFLTLTGRRVNAYDYLSGNWSGRIDTFSEFNLAAGYTVPKVDTLLKLSWSNVTDEDKTQLLGTPAQPSFLTFEIYQKF
ncbi:TonB-dependent receptor plug domain-containing protein [Acanthopleuribacter pedis]|uniref:TonB-dependent receptor plug domain-containing protein n=1 Tax=Acanthopleuribacter pedis TaxID=442870 RepID=A0A8J7Q5P6_9BACT|nr:TonB-dependent receptor plug domain-containing protein [Acanthopleuribacter pedis]MBO1317305.1 TonB-dependent receptor plug domain-containing protein [Acanthopleuribacter pedis]MBO1318612.1 TonB-dependent receptor plug domain-containing protein [Acanthopleuribacter pedis]